MRCVLGLSLRTSSDALMGGFVLTQAHVKLLLQAFVLRLSQLLSQLHADSPKSTQAELEDYIL